MIKPMLKINYYEIGVEYHYMGLVEIKPVHPSQIGEVLESLEGTGAKVVRVTAVDIRGNPS